MSDDEEARPAPFDDHPELDLVIACDEGGPLAGFWLPQYSIGHNFAFGGGDGGTPRRGLWSAWGEQALWHELLHCLFDVGDCYDLNVSRRACPRNPHCIMQYDPSHAHLNDGAWLCEKVRASILTWRHRLTDNG